MNKKERRAALRSALTSRVEAEKLIVLDELRLEEIKTKEMQRILNNLKVEKAVIVLPEKDEKVVLSARNIPNVATISSDMLSVYDVMKYSTVIMTKAAVASIEEVYA